MKIKYLPFYLIVISLFILIVGPSLFSDGMFMDGLLYAAISKNLANNLGSFWDLHLTNTLYPHFHEHPPLAFGIQSLFFKLFGESIFVERFYSFITFIITGWIITRIWKKITNSRFHSLVWLPLLFWILIPLVTWAAANNMLENTMMIFTSLSVLFILKSLDSKRLLYLSLSGLMLFLGFLTKGFVALFPLSMMFWIFIIKRNINCKRFLIDTFVLCIATLAPLLIIYLISPESIDSLTAYFNKQIVGSLKNIQTVDSRFYILWRLFNELIPAGIILLIIIVFSILILNNFAKQKLFRISNAVQ
ncbi:MAG: glycosyltransferase family 39 protein, partial [Bacteroidales bacterium]|nr:glycosyltransferase family 39 protein [Bacteroidales bacterium]